MNNTSENPLAAQTPHTDKQESWDQLYDDIRVIALKRSSALLGEDDADERFDRGARALRTLMGAAEIARRMKLQDEKERDLHDGEPKPPAYTDEEIRKLYRDVVARVERVAGQEDGALHLRDGETGDSKRAGQTKEQGVDDPCP